MCDHQASIAWRVRIAFFVGVLVVHTMSGDPGDRSAFKRQRSADGQEILHPLWRLIAAVGKQTVVAHADAETARDPPQNNRQGEARPGKEKQRGDGAYMEQTHKNRGYPIDFVVCRCFPIQDFEVDGHILFPVPGIELQYLR